VRVKESRERKKAQSLGIPQPKKKPRVATPILISDEQRFADFVQLTRGNNIPENERKFIKQKLPGEWKTVFNWQKENKTPDANWRGLTEKMKILFRRDLWAVHH
jgi:hypothetical protein